MPFTLKVIVPPLLASIRRMRTMASSQTESTAATSVATTAVIIEFDLTIRSGEPIPPFNQMNIARKPRKSTHPSNDTILEGFLGRGHDGDASIRWHSR